MTETKPIEQAPRITGFEIRRRIATGPVSEIWEARQSAVDRMVWIKHLKANILPSSPFAGVLRQEAEILARLNHPNIASLLDFVESESQLYLVLEHVDGYPLGDLVQLAPRLDPDPVAAIGLQVSRALQHCFERKVVYHNLRPATIWIDREGTIKLTEFGAASLVGGAPALEHGETAGPDSKSDGSHAGSSRSRTEPAGSETSQSKQLSPTDDVGVDAGFDSPAYMSPERVLGEQAQPSSDVFSLGVVLYELLAGSHPFATDEEGSLAQRIRHQAAQPVSRVASQVSPELDRIIQRCLEKFPGDRYFSPRELAHALASQLSHTTRSANRILVEELVRVGLVEDVLGATARATPKRLAAPSSALPRTLVLFGACSLLLMLGLAVIEVTRADPQGAALRGAKALELVPDNAAYLRVVATPWAEVIIDGTHVETTPFAEPIPMAPGRHDIRFRHPKAPEEQRLVDFKAGATVRLDVRMKLTTPAVTPSSLIPPPPQDAGPASP